jgi:hypothetical protein
MRRYSGRDLASTGESEEEPMATTVTINNQTFKRRNPVAVWLGLPLITVGIYYFVWWYKVNNEAKRFLNDSTIRPGRSVLAITLGALIIVPPFISIYRTTERVARMQERAGMTGGRANPWISLVLAFLWGLDRLYVQMQLNQIWDGYVRGGVEGIASPSAYGLAPPTPVLPPPASVLPPPAPTLAPPAGPPWGPPVA